jgi:hypothetical protein
MRDIYRYIEAEKVRSPALKVSVACRALGVSTSGFYGWRARLQAPPRSRVAADAGFLVEIRLIHGRFAYYGSPQIDRNPGRLRHAQHLIVRGARSSSDPVTFLAA